MQSFLFEPLVFKSLPNKSIQMTNSLEGLKKLDLNKKITKKDKEKFLNPFQNSDLLLNQATKFTVFIFKFISNINTLQINNLFENIFCSNQIQHKVLLLYVNDSNLLLQ